LVYPDQLNQSMFHMRWTRGDPADKASDPTAATFSIFYDKTGFKAEVKGALQSTIVKDTSFSISIGNNTLSFDGTSGSYGMWAMSVDIEQLKMAAVIDPVLPSVPFDPSYNGQVGLLVPGYYVSHPIYRGHTNGTVTLPNGQSWASLQVSTLKHTYGYKPIQNLLPTYTRLSTFIGASTLNWYTAKSKSGKDVSAAQFVYGAPDLSEVTLKYQVTNEPSILGITSSVSGESHNYTVTLAGCNQTLNNPYTFNSTSLVNLGAITDSAGGKTEYWSVDTGVLFYINGQPWTNPTTVAGLRSLGVLEVYASSA